MFFFSVKVLCLLFDRTAVLPVIVLALSNKFAVTD